MKALFFLLGLCCVPFVLPAQREGEELMAWSPTRKLSWADYKASPDPNSDAAATTATYLVFSYSIRNEVPSFTIESKFSKTRSWGLHKTAYILSHEQGHFDISEIFARKLYKKIKEYRFNTRSYQKDLKKIYQDILDEKEKMQAEYDRETNHSINKEKQAEWLEKISRELEKYAAFSGYQNNP